MECLRSAMFSRDHTKGNKGQWSNEKANTEGMPGNGRWPIYAWYRAHQIVYFLGPSVSHARDVLGPREQHLSDKI